MCVSVGDSETAILDNLNGHLVSSDGGPGPVPSVHLPDLHGSSVGVSALVP